MAAAIIARLQSARNIIASDIDPLRLAQLKKKYGIKITKSNQEAFLWGEIVILAVKPQQMAEVISEIKKEKGKIKKLIISIAAGIPLKYLEKNLSGYPIIRAMPNSPALIGQGITALAAGRKVSKAQMALAVKIFAKVGLVDVVPEKWLDAVTGLSGSGPAFIYDTLAALAEGGVVSGLPRHLADRLACQTVIGAVETFKATSQSHQELKAMVASPGGTTVEGLAVLEEGGYFDLLCEAVAAAARKSKKLSSLWTK
jgi:pyrroline-5-carboxylate reductase